MFNWKLILLVVAVQLAISRANFEECNKLTIEGGERALKKIFQDFSEIRSTVNDLKSRNEKYTKNEVAPIFDSRVDIMSEKCYRSDFPKDCAGATQCTRRSGIYKIQMGQLCNEPFYAVCDAVTDGGDWMVIQKRQDGSEDFYRDWSEYENGFGDIEGEFFIGLKKLYALTNFNGPQELLVVMEDGNYTSAYAKYDSFVIGNAADMYKLKRVGKYSGTAGNSLQNAVGMKFTTKDRDNDLYKDNCAVTFTGAWWYRSCHHSNLNGKYGDNTFGKGINWYHYRGHTLSLPYVKMMIRRSRNV